MNDEIKNILKCLEMDMLDNKQIEILLDYITNLQEENKRLNNIINKAVSILKDLKYIDKYKFTWDREFNKALNILQGVDKE